MKQNQYQWLRGKTVARQRLLPRLALSVVAALFLGQASAQPIAAAVGQPDALRFKDFYVTPIGPRGLEMSSVLREANGKTVTLSGYMVQQEQPLIGQFLLTVRPVQMSEDADGEADDLPPTTVVVVLDPSQKDWVVPHVRGLMQVQGQLSVGRQETQSGRVFWVQLHLPSLPL